MLSLHPKVRVRTPHISTSTTTLHISHILSKRVSHQAQVHSTQSRGIRKSKGYERERKNERTFKETCRQRSKVQKKLKLLSLHHLITIKPTAGCSSYRESNELQNAASRWVFTIIKVYFGKLVITILGRVRKSPDCDALPTFPNQNSRWKKSRNDKAFFFPSHED